jgi:hypothetical protein
MKASRVTLPLSIEEIEIAGQRFKESLQREASRYIRRHNSEGAIAALEAIEYLDKFLSDLKIRAGSRLGAPARAHALIEQRDAEWTQVVLEIPDKILTPDQGLKWLTRDRELRARHVSAARRLRGPVRW